MGVGWSHSLWLMILILWMEVTTTCGGEEYERVEGLDGHSHIEYVHEPKGPTPHQVSIGFWLLIAPPPTLPPSQPLYRSVFRKPSNRTSAIPALWLHPEENRIRYAGRGSWVLDDECVADVAGDAGVLAPGVWHHVGLVAEYGRTRDRVRVYVNATRVAEREWVRSDVVGMHGIEWSANIDPFFLGADPWSRRGVTGAMGGFMVLQGVALDSGASVSSRLVNPTARAITHFLPRFLGRAGGGETPRWREQEAQLVAKASQFSQQVDLRSIQAHWVVKYAVTCSKRRWRGAGDHTLIPRSMMEALVLGSATGSGLKICVELDKMESQDAVLALWWRYSFGLCAPRDRGRAAAALSLALDRYLDARAALLSGALATLQGETLRARELFILASMLGSPYARVASALDAPAAAWEPVARLASAAAGHFSQPPFVFLSPAVAVENILLSGRHLYHPEPAALVEAPFAGAGRDVTSWLANGEKGLVRIERGVEAILEGDLDGAKATFSKLIRDPDLSQPAMASIKVLMGLLNMMRDPNAGSTAGSLFQQVVNMDAPGGARWLARLAWAHLLMDVGDTVSARNILTRMEDMGGDALPGVSDELLGLAWHRMASNVKLAASERDSTLERLVAAGSPLGMLKAGQEALLASQMSPFPWVVPHSDEDEAGRENREGARRALMRAGEGSPMFLQLLHLGLLAPTREEQLEVYAIASMLGSGPAARNGMFLVQSMRDESVGDEEAMARFWTKLLPRALQWVPWGEDDVFLMQSVGAEHERSGDMESALACYVKGALAVRNAPIQALIGMQELGAESAFSAVSLLCRHPFLSLTPDVLRVLAQEEGEKGGGLERVEVIELLLGWVEEADPSAWLSVAVARLLVRSGMAHLLPK